MAIEDGGHENRLAISLDHSFEEVPMPVFRIWGSITHYFQLQNFDHNSGQQENSHSKFNYKCTIFPLWMLDSTEVLQLCVGPWKHLLLKVEPYSLCLVSPETQFLHLIVLICCIMILC